MAKTIPIITPEELEGRDPFGEQADTLGVPARVNVYERPDVPATDDKNAARNCRALFIALHEAMAGTREGDAHPLFALDGFDRASLALINQTLGEGEVSVKVSEPENPKFDEIRIVESVFIGVWRVQYFLKGVQIADEIEVGPLPRCVPASAASHAVRDLSQFEVAFPEGAMNSPAIIAELREVLSARKPGQAPFTVNLSHLPISQEDVTTINETLGVGSVYMISRGMGNCHISSTLVRDLWRIQYFNNAQASLMILNTLAVTDLPEEACASADDLEDSTRRIAEYVEWLTQNWELESVN